MSYFWKTIHHRENIIEGQKPAVNIRVEKEHEAVLGLVDLDKKGVCVCEGQFPMICHGNWEDSKDLMKQDDTLSYSSLFRTANLVEMEEDMVQDGNKDDTNVPMESGNAVLTDFFHDASNGAVKEKDELEKTDVPQVCVIMLYMYVCILHV